MSNLDQVWEKVQKRLITDMIDVHYNTWIKPLIPLKKKGSNVYIYSTIGFIKKIVNDKYKDTLESNLRTILNEDIDLVILDPKDELFTQLINEKDEDLPQEDKNPTQITFDLSGPLEELDKRVNTETPDNYRYKGTLNKKNTFDNFVRGKSNDLALAIAISVAENPGKVYNPFFIYGSSGLGKTHLMQAIGHKILEDNPEKKVIYITSEGFMNEFIATITDNKNSVVNSQIFRDKYRNCDVLMIDDIQFISGKESTQEEIFHTFNSLQQAKKQIVFTSDVRPEEIKGLEDRLVTRFSGGMIADIQKPDFETRVSILKHKINMDRYDVPNNVIEFIAENVTSNIRNLEGAILKVMAFYNLKKKNSNAQISDEEFLEIAKNALAIKEVKQKPITLTRIKEVVAKYYNLEPQDLVKQNRQKSISDPRQIAMHLSRQLTNLSLVKIADSFERDHATVIYGDDKVKTLMKEDESLRKDVENIIAILKK
ncbi:chromosomal replication initiator protein DnaA [Helcococcus kunzii]|uniref:chromosomal replication initiator protein DnaA n=1 Tax=Helcococcus kunzii TaxID=40091 RepID=UPI001BB0B239|nr:chromosomal replication initiator protein DnaA [Helcococcus kunzii]MCT1796842.1 chromosomal replication initiator protein DnaA [Helcococcus kunzii]MCT1988400.1 chromosomal replication initiator protein DnaA [Helcococcus kunzii]QUY65555.1 chromosomal replication initiator protein DnaA [Helcococcus kunzii]